MDLKDKVIVVTGASSGLGAAVAGKLAEMGSKLVLVAQNKDKLDEVAAGLKDKTETIAVCADISANDAPQQIIKAPLDTFGRIDTLVSNAGIWTDNDLEEKAPSRIEKAFAVNSIGAIRLIKAIVPIMLKQNAGHIFNTISTAGASDTEAGNNEDWMTYGATKWAMTGFTKALTKKLEPTPIRVTAFMPGGFESNLYESAGRENAHNQPWMMKTEDVAHAVLFCLTRPVDVQVEKMILTKKID